RRGRSGCCSSWRRERSAICGRKRRACTGWQRRRSTRSGSKRKRAEEVTQFVRSGLALILDFGLSDAQTPSIRLVAGLGNPGVEYAYTRHNIGFTVVDLLAHEAGLRWEKSGIWDAATTKFGGALLVKPASYMNRSGHPLFAIAQFFKI